MAKELEITVDDAHAFMIQEMTDGEMTAEEFVDELIEQMIYNLYQQSKTTE